MNKTKLLICEPNPSDLILYEGLDSLKPEMDITITNCSGTQLLSYIKSELPDIVLTEIELPQISALEIVRQISDLHIPCRFILTCRTKSFEYVYSALKLHVEDYLLKPFSIEDLKVLLFHTNTMIRNNPFLNAEGEDILTGRYKFISVICANPSYTFQNTEEINAAYYTHFHEGIFCALFAKLDMPNNAEMLRVSSQTICNRLEYLIFNYFHRLCYDIVTEKRIDGILFLINFHPDSKKLIYENINSLFADTKQELTQFPGINITLCVGKEYNNITCPYELKNSALDTRWLRMSAGIDRIILQQSLTVDNDDARFMKLCPLILHSCQSLNIEAFSRYINEFFELPYTVLSARRARKFVRQIIDTLLQINDAAGHIVQNSNAFRNNLDLLLNTSTNFEQFQKAFCSNIIQLMQKISEYSDKKYDQAIYQAITYIIYHYSDTISLEFIAELVHLSPTYFSMLFKKETGTTFSVYIIRYRLERAKESLALPGSGNISEIAASVGYRDVRYFSRLFHKYTGYTPTDYRKIYLQTNEEKP